MNYKLNAVRVFTTKWPETVAFYEKRVGLECGFKSDEMGWAEFDLGGARLAVERMAAEDPEASVLVGRFVGVSIAVDDIDRAYERLVEAGVEFVGPPEKQPWGGVLAHFKDPDDNVITLLG